MSHIPPSFLSTIPEKRAVDVTFPLGESAWAARQIAVYEKCVDASFVPFCDLAFQVGRGLVRLIPHQPCFGVLTAGTRESTVLDTIIRQCS